MPLTRGDKMIIIGAVALAVTVVLGLAILKKPYLFSGGAKSQSADIPPAPTAASAPEMPAASPPPIAPPVVVAPPTPAPSPSAPGASPMATAAASAPGVAPAPAPTPAVPAAAASAAVPANGPKPAASPAAAGDETLEKMFADIAGDAPAAGKSGEPKAAGPQAPASGDVKQAIPAAGPIPAPAPAPAPEPVAAPAETKPALTGKAAKAAARAAAKAEAKAKAEAGKSPAKAAKAPADSGPDVPPGPAPETHSAQPPIDKTVAAKPAGPAKKAAPSGEAAKPQAGVAGGNVVRIVAEEKPGEYVLLIQTNKSPASFTKVFMTDPPRMVLDLGGAWNYNGPLSSATGNDFIRQIRVGKHADMFRVVLDMAPDATTKLRGAPTVTRVPEGVELRIPK